ncbi:hypothetical protein PHLCEN_2v4662 [Hermanssonia centrifuga]|uniref:Peroxisome membrane anchor protein Pex14p N-terminal domain-containing protein n=1 Tax=Hermanssonia centrifuga TaxID=98765 RepID=A0A2R6PN62_9APHY|nr:hypothetical protein PHLCEN_2v4662 [Hermanssonia centrifuga]
MADENALKESPTPSQPTDRTELIDRARIFLNSPQVRYEDPSAKRRFLAEKGLNDTEIDGLLQELSVNQSPLVPPRTYPPPPPSNLPGLLIGIIRLFSWIIGGSTAVLLVYFRFIYPRLIKSLEARHALRSHQTDLLKRLNVSLESVKAAQKDAFTLLPQPQLCREDPKYSSCHSLDEVAEVAGDSRDIPSLTILRCAIEELGSQNQLESTEAVFKLIETKLPWIRSEEGGQFATKLWETLWSTPVFEQKEVEGTNIWAYRSLSPPPPPPLLSSLNSLRSAIEDPPRRAGRLQRTMQTLSDFTGYIASQTYTMSASIHYNGSGVSAILAPEEEDVRREIRALKGLVLNRYGRFLYTFSVLLTHQWD